jgi:hypothetical protein
MIFAATSPGGDSGTVVLIVILVCIAVLTIFAQLGKYVGRDKGRQREGFWLGMFLGPLGLIITALLQPTADAEAARAVRVQAAVNASTTGRSASSNTRPCPWCAEEIKSAAVVCRYCGRDVEAAAGPAGWEPEDSSETDKRWEEWSQSAPQPKRIGEEH